MKKFRKILFVLCTVIIFGLTAYTGLSAQAAKPTVATIGSKKYTNLNNAFKSVKRGQTIKLRKNVTVKKTINLNKNLAYTIDFNKKNITYKGKEDTALFNIKKGKIKVKNINVTANKLRGVMEIGKSAAVSITGGAARGYWINQGKLTLNKVRMRANYGKPFQALIKNYGTISISNCNMVFTGVGNVLYNASKGKATISGGVYQVVKADMEGANYPIIYNGGRMTIKKGTFSRKEDQYIIWNREKGNLTIKGGKFIGKATGKDNELKNATAILANEGNASILGGDFKGNLQTAILSKGKKVLKIKGGTFISTHNAGAYLYSPADIVGGKFEGKKSWYNLYNDHSAILWNGYEYAKYNWEDWNVVINGTKLKVQGMGSGRYTDQANFNHKGASYIGDIISLIIEN